MFSKLVGMFGYVFGCLAALFVFLFFNVISWIITCGFVYLITLCFGWTFSWTIATGVWLVMWLLNSIFKK